MSKPLDLQSGVMTIANQPGVGVLIAVAATTTAAGTGGYAPGGILLTTTTNKVYVNTGTATTATWTVVGSQS